MNPSDPPASSSPNAATAQVDEAALNRARRKAYWRLLPVLFVSYMVAYVDRQNVAVAKLTIGNGADWSFGTQRRVLSLAPSRIAMRSTRQA